jgi:hypothetical protein
MILLMIQMLDLLKDKFNTRKCSIVIHNITIAAKVHPIPLICFWVVSVSCLRSHTVGFAKRAFSWHEIRRTINGLKASESLSKPGGSQGLQAVSDPGKWHWSNTDNSCHLCAGTWIYSCSKKCVHMELREDAVKSGHTIYSLRYRHGDLLPYQSAQGELKNHPKGGDDPWW